MRCKTQSQALWKNSSLSMKIWVFAFDFAFIVTLFKPQSTDPVAMALNSAFNEEETQELPNGDQSFEMMSTEDIPTIRIPEEGGIWGPLQLSDDGNWIPV